MKVPVQVVGLGLATIVVGVGVVLLTAPDTGDTALPEPVAVTPREAPPVAPVAEEPAPEGLEAVAKFGPSKPVVQDEPKRATTWEDLLSGRVPDVPADREFEVINQHRVIKPGPSPDGGAYKRPGEDGGPLPVGLVGAELLFERRDAAIKECVKWTAPAKQGGEDRILVTLTVAKDPDANKGFLQDVVVQNDPEQRYQHFVPCLKEALAGAEFQVPHLGPTAEIPWRVWR